MKEDDQVKVFEDYVNGVSIFNTSIKFGIPIKSIEYIRRYFSTKYIEYARAINEPLHRDVFEPKLFSVYQRKLVLEFIKNYQSIEENISQIFVCEKIDSCVFVKCRSCEKTVEEGLAVCQDCFSDFLEQIKHSTS